MRIVKACCLLLALQICLAAAAAELKMVTAIKEVVQNGSTREFARNAQDLAAKDFFDRVQLPPAALQRYKAELERLRNEESRLVNEQMTLEHQRQEIAKAFESWYAEWNKNEATYHSAFQEQFKADDRLFDLQKSGEKWKTELAVCIKEEKELEAERVAVNEEIKEYNRELGNLKAALDGLRPAQTELQQRQAALDAEMDSINQDVATYNAKRKQADDSVSFMISWLTQEARAGHLNPKDVTAVFRNYQTTRRMSPVLYSTGIDRKACEANFIGTNMLLEEADKLKAAAEARKKEFAKKSESFAQKTKEAAKKLADTKGLVAEKDKTKSDLSERSKKYLGRKEALDKKRAEWTDWITAAEDAKKKGIE